MSSKSLSDYLMDGRETSALIDACRQGDHARLSQLIIMYGSQGKSLVQCDYRGWQAIHEVVTTASDDHLMCLRYLLNEDGDLVRSTTYENLTPLMVASGCGNAQVVKMLLERLEPHDLEQISIHGDNALIHALRCQETSAERVAFMLMEKNHSLEFLHPPGSLSMPIHVACANKKGESLKSLLLNGVSVTSCTVEEDPPLHICARFGWALGMRLIIEEAKRRHHSVTGPSVDTIKDLLDQENEAGDTVLSMICLIGSTDCMQVLMDEGLSPVSLIKNSQMYTLPISFAIHFFHQDLIKLLLSKMQPNDIDRICREAYLQQKYLAHPLSFINFLHPECVAHVKLLKQWGFCFDMDYVADDVGVSLRAGYISVSGAMSYIMQRIAKETDDHPHLLEIAEFLLKSGIRITPETVVNSCWNDQATSGHLLILKYLSRLPSATVKSVTDAVCLRNHEICAPKDKPDRTERVAASISPLTTFQLMMKGFSVTDSKRRHPLPQVEPSVFFFTDQEKRSLTERSPELLLAVKNSPLLRYLQVPSTLKSLCRSAIRRCLSSALLTEPVPRSWKQALSTCVADYSWEFSIINRLPLPINLQNFLRLDDVCQAYAQLYELA